MKKKLIYLLVLPVFLLFIALPANAVPLLQLYIEGATYDPVDETWVAPINDTFILWAIGNVAGDGGKGVLSNVNLAVAYSSADISTIDITIDGTTTSVWTDPSTPADPALIQTVAGSAPILYGGSSLAPHGIYGPGTSFDEFSLGTFDSEDSPIADLITSFPLVEPATLEGQINAYAVTITGTNYAHFDLYGSYEGSKVKATFAPFSHDASAVPIPSAMLLLGFGLVGIAGLRRKFKK